MRSEIRPQRLNTTLVNPGKLECQLSVMTVIYGDSYLWCQLSVVTVVCGDSCL